MFHKQEYASAPGTFIYEVYTGQLGSKEKCCINITPSTPACCCATLQHSVQSPVWLPCPGIASWQSGQCTSAHTSSRHSQQHYNTLCCLPDPITAVTPQSKKHAPSRPQNLGARADTCLFTVDHGSRARAQGQTQCLFSVDHNSMFSCRQTTVNNANQPLALVSGHWGIKQHQHSSTSTFGTGGGNPLNTLSTPQ